MHWSGILATPECGRCGDKGYIEVWAEWERHGMLVKKDCPRCSGYSERWARLLPIEFTDIPKE